MQVVLSPTNEGHYQIKDSSWTDTTITFSLGTKAGAKWADVRAEEQTQDMKVVSIDTGGGAVPMPGGMYFYEGTRRAGGGSVAFFLEELNGVTRRCCFAVSRPPAAAHASSSFRRCHCVRYDREGAVVLEVLRAS